jgi:signal transduction histidine kinase
LNLVWYRVIYRPIRQLLSQINLMGRGTWTCALPVKRNDEIGELTGAFNRLGEELTDTFRHISASSKMSALALIGNRLVREVTAVRSRVAAASHILGNRKDARVAAVAADLLDIERQLQALEGRFETEFDRELAVVAAGSAAAAPRAPEEHP